MKRSEFFQIIMLQFLTLSLVSLQLKPNGYGWVIYQILAAIYLVCQIVAAFRE